MKINIFETNVERQKKIKFNTDKEKKSKNSPKKRFYSTNENAKGHKSLYYKNIETKN